MKSSFLRVLVLIGFLFVAVQTPAQDAPGNGLKPLKLPDGETGQAWDLLLHNKFDDAQKAFEKILEADPKNLVALEGLRDVSVTLGRDKEVQKLNQRMVQASTDQPLCHLFIQRAMDTQGYVESRKETLEAFTKALESASPPIAAHLKDQFAAMHYQMNRPDEARKDLDGLGYLDHWQFAAGPFGSKDANNPIERRFAPDRPIRSLEFQDEAGKPVDVHKDVTITDRDLDMDSLFPGMRGVFYALTNIESDADQDACLMISASMPYRAYLRGMPVLIEPGDETYRRLGGDLILTRLTRGANPLLIKLGYPGSLIVRVSTPDYAPLKNIRYKPLTDEQLAAHETCAVRGLLYSQPATGSTATYFLKRISEEERKSEHPLQKLAENAELTMSEAVWLELALQRENENHAIEAAARRVLAAYPDSVYALEVGATFLASAGEGLGNSEAREVEEARRQREHALELLPTSQRHRLGLYHFLRKRQLDDQAFEMIKACAEAHPDSAMVESELGYAYERKQFMVEAEHCFEKAAGLDAAYLPVLLRYHDMHGNHVRARELRKQLIAADMYDLNLQYDDALQHADWKAAEDILTRQEKWWPERKEDFAARRVQLLIEKGDLSGAYELRRKLYDALPLTADRHIALLSLVDLALRLNKDDEAKAALRGYLKLHPGDFDLRHRLLELEGQDSDRWWEAYDLPVAKIDTSHFDSKNYPRANHAWIVDFMITKVLPDLSQESYIHIAQKVLNLRGIGELSEVLVRAQKHDIVMIRTLNPDGSAYMPQNVHDFNLAQTASAYKVGPGSILEHAYLEHQDANEDNPVLGLAGSDGLGFNFNAIDSPRALSRWVVLIPDALKDKLKIRYIRKDLIDEQTLPGPPGFTVYQWTNKQVEGIKQEPFMAADEAIPMVFIDSPERPYRDAARLLMRREREIIPPEAEAYARKITGLIKDQGGSESAQFAAILNWVRDKISPGTDSKTLDDVWFSHTGSASQMTLLSREMAQAAGLNVRAAYINSEYSPGRVWHSKHARRLWEPGELSSFGSGGRVLVLEQPGSPDRWAQFSGQHPRYFSLSDINLRQAGAPALIVGDEGARIKRVLGETLGLTQGIQRTAVELDAQGAGDVSASLEIYGFMAGSIRDALSDPRRATQVKESIIHNAWPKIHVVESKIENKDDPESALLLGYTGEVAGLASQARGELSLQAFPSRPRILDMQGPPQRESELVIKNEYSDLDMTYSYTAPEGFGWVEVPDDLFLCSEFGFYVEDYNVKGRKLYCTRSYLLPSQRVTPERYPALLDFLGQIAVRSEQRSTCAPLKSESFGGKPRDVFSQGYAGYGEEKKGFISTTP